MLSTGVARGSRCPARCAARAPERASRSYPACWRLGRRRVVAAASGSDNSDETREEELLRQRGVDQAIIGTAAVSLTVVATAGYYFFADDIADFLLDASLEGGEFGIGDGFGALMWGISFWFASPLQLLLLFFGDYDVERPSDRIIKGISSAAGMRVDDIDFVAPSWVRVAAASACLAFGVTVAAALNAGLGDATWSVSTGIGACMGALVYDVARPNRLSAEEAQLLEAQWRDFESWANDRLVRTGRCHESEVFASFRKQWPKYRQPDVVSDSVLRDMIRNWNPDVSRTPNGYLKNVSVVQRTDPFTLEVTGSAPNAATTAVSQPAGDSAQS